VQFEIGTQEWVPLSTIERLAPFTELSPSDKPVSFSNTSAGNSSVIV
jgi:hypothetical protein